MYAATEFVFHYGYINIYFAVLVNVDFMSFSWAMCIGLYVM